MLFFRRAGGRPAGAVTNTIRRLARSQWPLFFLLLLMIPGCQKKSSSAAAPKEGATTVAVDWCMSHGVPESICTRCNASLIPAFKAKGDWCAEHGLPESQCLLCHPDLKFEPPDEVKKMMEKGRSAEEKPAEGSSGLAPTPGGQGAVPASSAATQGALCLEHGVPEAECAICLPNLSEVLDSFSTDPATRELRGKSSDYPKVRLASKEAAAKAGLRAVRIGAAVSGENLTGAAEIVSDDNHSSPVASPVGGIVRGIRVNVGDRVTAGQVLAVIASPDIAEARATFQKANEEAALARKEAEREQTLREQRITSDRDYQAAQARDKASQAELAAARARLGALSQAEPVSSESANPSEYVLRSPIAGEVVGRRLAPGQVVTPGDLVIEISNRDHLWAEIALGPGQANEVRIGQAVSFSSEALGGQSFSGQVLSITPRIDSATRTVTVRAAMENPQGSLRPNLFGRAEISLGGAEEETLIPLTSVMKYSGHPIAFVRLSEDLFDVRPLVTGGKREEMIEVLSGVHPGEEVVTDGAFLLKTQISKGSIGAGCCDVAAVKH